MAERVAAAFLCLGLACAPTADADGRVRIVTTVSPITNIVANIGGEHVSVTGLVPEGVNSHTFEPAPADARVIAEADIVFANGLSLEQPTLELARANTGGEVPIVSLAERAIEPHEYIYDFSFPKEQGNPNPHLWTHPLYALMYAQTVKEELTRLAPEAAKDFAEAYKVFAERIEDLDRAVRASTKSVPADSRKLLTYHDSFPYFARAYGWEVVGAIQPSDFSDPSPREVGTLIEQIRSTGVPAIFGSEVFPSPVLEQIAGESGAEYVDDLRDDDLPGNPGDDEHSYLGLMVFDLRTIVSALGGDASPFDRVDTANIHDSAEYRR